MSAQPDPPEATFWRELAAGRTAPLRAGGVSMWPLHPSGSLFLIEPVPAAALRLGDLVLQQRGETLRLHRLLGWDAAGVPITKGDGLPVVDATWPRSSVRGRAVAVVRDGAFVELASPRASIRAWWLARLSRPTGRLLGLSGRFRPLVPGPAWRLARGALARLLRAAFYQGMQNGAA